MAELDTNNLDKIEDDQTRVLIGQLVQRMEDSQRTLTRLEGLVECLEMTVEQQQKELEPTFAFYGDVLTDLPHGVNKALTESIVSDTVLCFESILIGWFFSFRQ